jgi:hypothetical protein
LKNLGVGGRIILKCAPVIGLKFVLNLTNPGHSEMKQYSEYGNDLSFSVKDNVYSSS